VVGLSTKWSLRAINFLTFLKVLSSILCVTSMIVCVCTIVLRCCHSMVIVGVAVLVGITRIKDPYANFQNIFEGSTSNLNSLATALVKINFSFVGWQNAFNVLGEVRSTDPVRTIRKAGFISLALVTVLFFLINIAYVAAVPREEIRHSGQLIAALFFYRVFGDSWGAKVLPAMVALSTFGNIVSGSNYLTFTLLNATTIR